MITTLLLIISTVFHLSTTAFAIGVNYGTLGNNLPPPSQVAKFLKTQTTIDSIKIFDTNPEILRAFANTNITVTVTVGNGDIPTLVDAKAARRWVDNNIKPYFPQTRINLIVIGNEILFSGNKQWIQQLVPCMESLHRALVQAGINDIKVSTPHTLGILQNSVQPSAARIRPGYDRVVFTPMLAFLRKTKSPLLVNPYPYFSYSQKMENYILFKPNPGVHDDNTNITYTSMFVAMLDAVYSAIKAMGYDDLEIVVAETGWPSLGDPDQPFCSVQNAVSYNQNMIKVVTSGTGTPLMQGRKFQTYIFALFNENLKPGTAAERNWGLFRPDLTPVYDVGIMRNGQVQGAFNHAMGESPLPSSNSNPPLPSSNSNPPLPSLSSNPPLANPPFLGFEPETSKRTSQVSTVGMTPSISPLPRSEPETSKQRSQVNAGMSYRELHVFCIALPFIGLWL